MRNDVDSNSCNEVDPIFEFHPPMRLPLSINDVKIASSLSRQNLHLHDEFFARMLVQ